jgi:hypothetical protein
MPEWSPETLRATWPTFDPVEQATVVVESWTDRRSAPARLVSPLVTGVRGRRMKAVYEVDRYEPHRLTGWRTVPGPCRIPFGGISRSPRVAPGSRSPTTRSRALLKQLAPLVIRMGRRHLEGDLPALRAILEGQTTSPTEAAGERTPRHEQA